MLNPRVTSLNKSSTLKITAATKKLKKEGKDVVNFAAGEPDFDTPDFVKQAGIDAINNGFTKYTPSAGIVEFREIIAKKLKEENGMDVTPANIIVTTGAKYAVFAGIMAVVEPGDEVIMAAPYWVSYPEMVNLVGGVSVVLPMKPENDFKLDIADLEGAITSKTKLVIVNYPSNPTGVTYNKQELQAICDVLKGKGIFVLSDEIYENLIYDGNEHVSFATLDGAKDITLTVNGFSKSTSMTGWRLGYIVGPEEIISEISKIIDHTTSCACSISQKAAMVAFTDPDWQEKIRKEFQERRDLLYKGLEAIPLIKPNKPGGTFYMFCDITETGLTSMDFASKLLDEYLVSVIPACGFGAEGFIRLSYSTSKEEISKGVERIAKFMSELNG